MNAVQCEIRDEACRVREELALNPPAYARAIGSLDNLVMIALKLAETPEPVVVKRPLLALRRTA